MTGIMQMFVGGGKGLILAPAVLFTTVNESTYTVLTTDTYRVFLGGGGGAGGTAARGGSGGMFYFDVNLTAGETIYAGVGAGGKSAIQYSQSTLYPMYGGRSNPGNGAGGGGGGGGSYLKAATPGSRPNWSSYLGIAGGGGGGASHNFTANVGPQHGYGVGGAAYNTGWPNGAETTAGRNGYNNTGAGGLAQSAGAVGGASSNASQLNGGDAGTNATAQGGGGGGGGAGGGGGGASKVNGGAAGGYISTTAVANGFNTVAFPRGGGGGGSHGNDCGGTGGGGGVLLFSDYVNSFSGTKPTEASDPGADAVRTYAAWSDLPNWNAKTGSTLQTLLATKCYPGGPLASATDNGFVLIIPKSNSSNSLITV